MKAHSNFKLVLDIWNTVNNTVEDKGAFNDLCIDIAYLSTLDKQEKYLRYFVFNSNATTLHVNFDEALLQKNKGYEGIYRIEKENNVYSFSYIGREDKVEE